MDSLDSKLGFQPGRESAGKILKNLSRSQFLETGILRLRVFFLRFLRQCFVLFCTGCMPLQFFTHVFRCSSVGLCANSADLGVSWNGPLLRGVLYVRCEIHQPSSQVARCRMFQA